LLAVAKNKEFFLVGSDYVFLATANTIIKAQLEPGGKTVGEDYYPWAIQKSRPLSLKLSRFCPMAV